MNEYSPPQQRHHHRWSGTGKCVSPGCFAERVPGAELGSHERLHVTRARDGLMPEEERSAPTRAERRAETAKLMAELLSAKEAGVLLGRSPGTVRLMAHRGLLRFVVIGGGDRQARIGYTPESVNAERNRIIAKQQQGERSS